MARKFKLGWLVLLSACAASAQPDRVQLRTASGHPIEYYLSLPQGWTPDKKWPVVVIVESANRQFRETIGLFVKARQTMPFILVAPLVVTNGGSNYRRVPSYHYPEAVWSEIEQAGGCRFDLDGLRAVTADVHKLDSGEEKVFLTGWEAGGHTAWAMIFQHPGALRAAAPSGPNYAGRCMDDTNFSPDPARVDLPIKVFEGCGGPAKSVSHRSVGRGEKGCTSPRLPEHLAISGPGQTPRPARGRGAGIFFFAVEITQD